MDKKQLLDFVQSLPDNVQVLPVSFRETVPRLEHQWESIGKTGSFGGLHQKLVDNQLELKLAFTTKFQGEFLRTYCNPDGMFFNVRRIN